MPANERPTAFDVAYRAWMSLYQAARQMPLLFLGCFAVLLAYGYASKWLPGYTPTPAGEAWIKHPSGPPPDFWRALPWIALSDLMTAIILAPLAVAVHRFVLLGEIRRSLFYLTTVTLQFALLITFFQLVEYFQHLFLLGRIAPSVAPLISLVYWSIVCWTLLVFPSLAVEEPSENFARRLDTAIGRVKGRFWLILRSLLLTVFLMFLAMMVAVMWPISKHLAEIQNNPSAAAGLYQSWPYIIGFNMELIAVTALGASTASWLYSYAAGKPPADYAAR